MTKAASERVKRMKKNFIRLHNEGKTIAEIAKEFQITNWTIYKHLQEIADENGVSRESLLQVPQKEHTITNYSKCMSSQIDIEQFENDCSEAILRIQNARKQINDYLYEEEQR